MTRIDIKTLTRPGCLFSASERLAPFFQAQFGAEHVPHSRVLTDCAYAMLKPDAVSSGRSGEILAFLHERGFSVVHYAVLDRCSDAHFQELYKFNISTSLVSAIGNFWWLNRKMWSMGPTVSLLLHRREGAEDLFVDLNRVKGEASPFECSSDQLRHIFQACNRNCNLLHTADSPISSLREFLIFHDVESLDRAVTAARDADNSDLRALHDRMVARLLSELDVMATARHRVDFLQTLTKVKLSLAKCLEAGAAYELLDQYSAVANRSGPERRLARYMAMRDLCYLERKIWLALTPATPAESVLRQCLLALCDFDGFCHDHYRELESVIDYFRIRLQGWDLLTLETSLHYFEDVRQFLKRNGQRVAQQHANGSIGRP